MSGGRRRMSKGKPQRAARATLCVFSTAGLSASLEKEHRMSDPKRHEPIAAVDDDSPQDDLEAALLAIRGVADVLRIIGDDLAPGPKAIYYLADRLSEHHEQAQDAFCRIYGLDQHRPGCKG